jgi:hypothetical protein
MTVNVVCVFKSGGCYDAEDVFRLQQAVEWYLPDCTFACFSDVAVDCDRVPLRYGWPGWWSKMEIFDPRLRGDLLYFDLDSMPVGDLRPLDVGRLAIMRDVYRPHGLQSAVMFVPQAEKAAIWEAFTADPDATMERCTTPDKWGDQGFLEEHWIDKAARLQDLAPGAIVSYKIDVQGRGVPANAGVVVFHGNPKPRDIGWQL